MSEYVVFSMDFLNEMKDTITYNIGTIFSVCIYTFVIVISIYAMIEVIRSVAQ